MNDLAFADAVRPRPRSILRVPLLPYSLGHELLLVQRRNLLLFENWREAEPGEQRAAIINAVIVCSKTWEQNGKPEPWLNLWLWRIRKEDFSLAIADFHNYREEGSTIPRIVPPKKSGGRLLGSPLLARIAAFGFGKLGVDAFDQPLGMLHWMYFSEAESDGGCEVENDDERSIREQVEKFEADYAKEQEGKN